MDCRTCQPNLLDLAHGELAPELSTAMTEHVAGCASCSTALSNLRSAMISASELPWLEPPPSLRVNALAFAAQHAKQRALSGEAAKSHGQARVGVLQGVLDFLGRLAAGRQFAMATVMVLIVAVGLWSLPELQRIPSGQGITVVSPDPDGEAAPSGGLAPAEPLDLAVDARSRRIRSREELAASNNPYKAQGEDADEAEPPVAAVLAEAPAAPEQKNDELDLDNLDSVLTDPAASFKKELSTGDAVARADTSREQAGGSALRAKGKAGPEAFPKSEEAKGLGGLSTSGQSAQGAGRANGAPSVDDLLMGATASRPAKPVSPPSPVLQEAAPMEREASTAASASAEKKASSTPLARARQVRASRGCAAAVPAYEQATKDPASRGTALIELAICQRQLGRESSARALLEQAQAIPAVASRARSLLGERKAKPAAAADTAASSPARD